MMYPFLVGPICVPSPTIVCAGFRVLMAGPERGRRFFKLVHGSIVYSLVVYHHR